MSQESRTKDVQQFLDELPRAVKNVFGLVLMFGASFIGGAIFWAGASYNRLDALDKHIQSIDTTLVTISTVLGDYRASQVRIEEAGRRINELETRFSALELRISGGLDNRR